MTELEVEPSIARADELARRWAIALILARPLDRLGELPLEEIAREAPGLCAQALRAVQSDVELERLSGLGASSARERAAEARRLATVCGAREPAALVEAVEALRGVLWASLIDALSEPPARVLADVGDRLAYVCAGMLAAGVESIAPGTVAAAQTVDLERSSPAPVAQDPACFPAPGREVVIIDERPSAGEVAASREPSRSPSLTQVPSTRASSAGEHARLCGETRSAAPGGRPPEIEIRDERRAEGPAAWISSIGAQLARFEQDSAPFAVLLVELVDVERLRRQGPPEELMRLTAGLERALAAALESSQGSLARERPGRCWLLVPGMDRAGAERLARQLMRELPSGAGERRAQLIVAIGTAICPEDGREPAALAAHADIGLYAARSALRASRVRAVSPLDEAT
jgi:GGDEF domain-containing protein